MEDVASGTAFLLRALGESFQGLFFRPVVECCLKDTEDNGAPLTPAARSYFEDTERNRFIHDQCPALTNYRPAPWAPGPHSQTAYAALVPTPRVKYRRQLLHMADRVKVALDWCSSAHTLHEDSVIVLVLPGIACSSEGKCVQSTMAEVMRRGWRGVVYNRRGHAGTRLLPDDGIEYTDLDSANSSSHNVEGRPASPVKPFPLHVDLDDLDEVVAHICQCYPEAKIICIGISLGSNLLLRYLGERGDSSGVFAGVSVANGFDMGIGTACLAEQDPLVDSIITSKMKNLLREHQKDLTDAQLIDSHHTNAMLKSKSLRHFDEVLVKNVYGYESVDEYYKYNSCAQHLKGITCPVLCLTDQDDPLILNLEVLKHPLEAGRVNPNLFNTVTRTGGHLGWLEGWKGESWCVEATSQYITALVSAPAGLVAPQGTRPDRASASGSADPSGT